MGEDRPRGQHQGRLTLTWRSPRPDAAEISGHAGPSR
jgi:hypothetical protein